MGDAMLTNLSGSHALVTGGASGIGLRTVLRLLQADAAVTLIDLNRPDAEGLLGNAERLHVVAGDASDADVLRAAIAAGEERFGPLRHAVIAAGITGKLQPILDQPDDAMDALLAVNVRGTFLALRLAAERIRAAGGGGIVAFASVYAKGAHANMVLYGATKHAVVGLVEGAAVEFAQYGIRVNAVAPGPILTPFIGTITPEIEAAVIAGIPQRRIGEPDEVAGAVLWLLSDAASYVTGATIVIDGGQAARLAG